MRGKAKGKEGSRKVTKAAKEEGIFLKEEEEGNHSRSVAETAGGKFH